MQVFLLKQILSCVVRNKSHVLFLSLLKEEYRTTFLT